MSEPVSPTPPPVAPASRAEPTAVPTHFELFWAFLVITLSGFGGTLAWTRRMFVEKKRWMTAEEFNNDYAFCQFLPGPNIVNLTAVFGSRMRGATGAVAAWSGFLLVPFCVMLAAGFLYDRYGDVDAVRRVLNGVAPAAAGLILATVAKMAVPMFRGLQSAPFIMAATAIAIGLMRWPLLLVLIVLVPISLAFSFRQASRAKP